MRAILLLAAMAALAVPAAPASAQAAHGDAVHRPLPLDGRLERQVRARSIRRAAAPESASRLAGG